MEEMKQFDIWVCDFTKCVDFADYGVRPCIIVSNDTNNLFSDRVNIIPLPTTAKKPQITHCIISSSKVTSTALCENVTTVYKSRLIEKCGSLNDFEKQNVLYCLKKQLEMN